MRKGLSLAAMAVISMSGCDRREPTPSTRPDADGEHEPAVGAHHRPPDHRTHDGFHDSSPGHSHQHRGGQHRFEDAEQWAKVFDDPDRDAWQKPQSVLRFIGLQPGATVADIGAGTGYFAVRFAREVPQGTVLATDVEPDMVRYLGERARQEDIDNLVPLAASADDPGLDRKVHVAFMCDVYHHIEEPETFFGRVAEQLAPKGRVVIVDFDPDAPEDAPGPPKAMRVSADEIAKRLGNVGLVESRRDTASLPYQYILELEVAAERAGS